MAGALEILPEDLIPGFPEDTGDLETQVASLMDWSRKFSGAFLDYLNLGEIASTITTNVCGIQAGSYSGSSAARNISLGVGNKAVYVKIKRKDNIKSDLTMIWDGGTDTVNFLSSSANHFIDLPVDQHIDGFSLAGSGSLFENVNETGFDYTYMALYILTQVGGTP